MEHDPRLRALYRLAEIAEGEELARVREAIALRRRELEQQQKAPSAWDGLPDEDPPEEWTPGAVPFRPAPPDAVPLRARRPGERGYRIVGTRRRRRPSA